ncbi:hypothetical protein GCM10027194_33360 [Thalassiella azotivora]
MTAAPQDVLTEVVQAFTDFVEGYVEATQEFTVGWGTLALINAVLAQGKGRRGWVWFLLSLPFGPFATLVLALLATIVHDDSDLDDGRADGRADEAPHDPYDDSEHLAAQRAARPALTDERPQA